MTGQERADNYPPLLIFEDDLRRALAAHQSCRECSGGLGVVITPPEQWDVVAMHVPGCPGLRCGGRLAVVRDE